MNDNNLIWLLHWYHSQCDGDWEHGNGIKIGTIDNPGWSLKVSLNETELADKEFTTIDINRSESDWIYCSIKNEIFEGFGGPFNLSEILQIFHNWAESNKNEASSIGSQAGNDYLKLADESLPKDKAIIIDSLKLMCTNCVETWECAEVDGQVTCPKCKKTFSNPRLKDA
ncbi:MAG: immunity 53 family protein [Verrucomicrobiota bacterium]|nr:immunity 53 family protein [Verrucomicrobiota bacterium]